MHHPPFDAGLAANDDMHCEGADALARIIERHPQVQAILCGHLHRSIARRWAGTLVATGAATAPTLELMLDGRGPEGWIDTPPMIGLHLWREGDGLVSHVVAADERARYAAFPDA
jgi:3',5'-cyclic AMP phosphodiesterase CpdA